VFAERLEAAQKLAMADRHDALDRRDRCHPPATGGQRAMTSRACS
jgi:hypothetical protein